MDLILRDLAEPFERMSADAASAALLDRWGIEAATLDLLDTERDDSWRVTTADGSYVFKVAHPADEPALIELQSAAMALAAVAGLPVQRVIAALDGREHPVIGGRVARVLTWLEGDLLLDSARPPGLLFDCGRMLARLARAIGELGHPASRRTFAWDLQALGALRDLPHSPAAETVFDRFDRLDLGMLPRQFIHNDFHPGNVLVSTHGVAGVLDFGDALDAPRVQDLGVALAYLLPETGDPWAAVAPMLEGYTSVTPLIRAEVEALPTLVAGRLVQRLVLPPVLDPDGADPAALARTARILDNLLAEA